MGFFDTIYIVTTEKLNEELLEHKWFWDRIEADQAYEAQSEMDNRIVTLYSFDLRTSIEDKLRDLMANRHSRTTVSPLEELRSSRQAETEAEDVTWGELRFDPDGSFYIEMLKESTSEHWPYTIEPYTGQLARGTQAWRVLDATTATPLAIIRPKEVGTSTAFTVIVNGYSQTRAFPDLKSAVIFAATEYNGC